MILYFVMLGMNFGTVLGRSIFKSSSGNSFRTFAQLTIDRKVSQSYCVLKYRWLTQAFPTMQQIFRLTSSRLQLENITLRPSLRMNTDKALGVLDFKSDIL